MKPELPKTVAAPNQVTPPSLAPVKPPVDLSKPPAPVTVPNPVIIRKAIMPTPEEIARFKQGLIKPPVMPLPVRVNPVGPIPLEPLVPQQLGTLPTMKMASPVDAEKKS